VWQETTWEIAFEIQSIHSEGCEKNKRAKAYAAFIITI